MANKRVSSENLVSQQIHITPTQKHYLESLDSPISRTIRDLIDGHKSRFNMDLKRLYQRKKELEVELALVSNEIKIREEEIREETEKKNEYETTLYINGKISSINKAMNTGKSIEKNIVMKLFLSFTTFSDFSKYIRIRLSESSLLIQWIPKCSIIKKKVRFN